MDEVLLILLCIIGTIISLYVLYRMPRDFLKQFEKSCRETIKKKDREIKLKRKI